MKEKVNSQTADFEISLKAEGLNEKI